MPFKTLIVTNHHYEEAVRAMHAPGVKAESTVIVLIDSCPMALHGQHFGEVLHIGIDAHQISPHLQAAINRATASFFIVHKRRVQVTAQTHP